MEQTFCEHCGGYGAAEDWDDEDAWDWLGADDAHRELLRAAHDEDALRHLGEHGPLGEPDLLRLLARDGWESEVTENFFDDVPAHGIGVFPDGRIALMDEAVDRTVLTRRLTAHEIATDTIVAAPDLTAITEIRHIRDWGMAALAEFFRKVSGVRDSGRLGEVTEDSLMLARGSLSRCTSGDLVSVRILRNGAVRFARVPDDPEPTDMRPALDEAAEGLGYCELLPVLWEKMWKGSLFRAPTLPVSELVSAAGYALQRGWAVRDGVRLPGC